MAELPGYGRHLGYDGKAVPSRSTGNASAATGRTSDPDADWGRHETSGVDRAGKAWRKVKRWFGYRLHLIADVEHELPVWFEVTRASRSEHKALSEGLDGLFEAEPGLASRCADFVADRGLDSGPLRRRLWDGRRIRPLVDVREMWREERAEPGHDPSKPIRRSLAADGGGNILRTEKGEVSCRCPAAKALRPMAFQGLRGGPGLPEAPLPGGGLRAGVRGPGGVPSRRRLEGRGVRAGGAHPLGGRGPPGVHADALGQPVVEARPRPARGA